MLIQQEKQLQQQSQQQQEIINKNNMNATSLHIAKFAASNSSLSDSGISDGGAMSDGGLSEREHRLNVLRRLAKQLESTLAPGSAAMISIGARIETAEADLKQLQSTCRELIVRSATTHQQQQKQNVAKLSPNKEIKAQFSKCQGSISIKNNANNKKNCGIRQKNTNSDAIVFSKDHDTYHDENDENYDGCDSETSAEKCNKKSNSKTNWIWRIAKAALPMQLMFITFFCVACFMQPNCCDNMNSLTLSFTPQLRYIHGPPPI